MKINVKTLKGTEFFEVNLQETDTVAELKSKIAAEKSKEKDTIKLVHKGKQLNDEAKTIKEIGIKENDFIILMVFLKKGEKLDEPALKNPDETNVSANTTATTAKTTETTSSAASTSVQKPAEKKPETDSELEEDISFKIQEIQNMGFERSQVLKALKAAYYNSERAVEYLVSGNIPEVRERLPVDDHHQHGQVPSGNPDIERLAQLAQNPEFQQIASAIRQNPALLQPIMAQLAQTNPEVGRILQENPQELISLLFGASENEGGQTLPPNAIEVTEEENADIEEIISMGFSKEDSIEAYLTCDKNKEIAINYLFEAKENGTLLSEHINKEELEAAKEESLHPGQNKPPNGEEGDFEDEDDEDDNMYQ